MDGCCKMHYFTWQSEHTSGLAANSICSKSISCSSDGLKIAALYMPNLYVYPLKLFNTCNADAVDRKHLNSDKISNHSTMIRTRPSGTRLQTDRHGVKLKTRQRSNEYTVCQSRRRRRIFPNSTKS